MDPRRTPLLDMTPDGSFRGAPSSPLATRIGRWALVTAIAAGGLAAALLALWFALALIPIAIGAALVAWAAFRLNRWRAAGGGGALDRWSGGPPRA